MTRPLIKVCGITRHEDAKALDALGIDFLGFNFHPHSKRYVSPTLAAEIIGELKHAKPVGVFVDLDAAKITDIARQTGIGIAQLHGTEPWSVLDALDMPVIKALPADHLGEWGGLRHGFDAHCAHAPEYFLVDSAVASQSGGSNYGGSGVSFEWTLLRPNPLPRPFFLAGGLGAHNLVAALKACLPFALDLNSKVESVPGFKDIAKVEDCLEILAMGEWL